MNKLTIIQNPDDYYKFKHRINPNMCLKLELLCWFGFSMKNLEVLHMFLSLNLKFQIWIMYIELQLGIYANPEFELRIIV